MLNLRALNAMNRERFTEMIGPVFEHSPWIADLTWPERPFKDRAGLHAALCKTVSDADEDAQLALIRAHPDLVGRATLTRESQSEQAYAGLETLSRDEVEQFRELNSRYRKRFGFPFVICARLNKKEAILDAFPRRLKNSMEQERRTALEEIYKIAELRLERLVE
jgi:2-oxo-4-hydroxy-4-carboxy-5-ureidoimidazoline decarboxylase